MSLVKQDPQQLRNGACRVRIVQLDSGFLGKGTPIGVAAAKAPYEVRQRAGHKKVLLHETQSLPHAGRVVRVQDSGKRCGFDGLGDRADELPVAELLEIKIMRSI